MMTEHTKASITIEDMKTIAIGTVGHLADTSHATQKEELKIEFPLAAQNP